MYKSRITKWNLDKNIKGPEALAVLRKKFQRDADGKDSVFSVRGKPITIDDVLRYFKRKGNLDPEAEARRLEVATPPAIECWTPFASPKVGSPTVKKLEEKDLQRRTDSIPFQDAEGAFEAYPNITEDTQTNDGMQAFLSIEEIWQILFSNPGIQSFEIPHSPLPPQNLLVPEKLFTSIKVYYISAIESRLFEIDDRGIMVHFNARY